jgi:acyl-CoA synthetase (NDP forming)
MRHPATGPDLEFLFHPRSIAIVGTPSDPATNQGAGVFLDSLLAFGYRRDIYPVNPKLSRIKGLKCYPDLTSLPRDPDLVICCIPAALTLQLVKDCASRGVKVISLYTAGFSEAGEDGAKLERELLSLARRGGIRLIGPNCMGLYCPSTRLSYSPLLSKEAGIVGLLCQSGGISLALTIMGNFMGVHFSKAISYGNAADLNEADFLQYLSQDNDTGIVGAYIEGVKDGPRFLRILTRLTRHKPVAVLKGGRTNAGAKATASHTGSLAGDEQIWKGLCRQAGAIPVHSSEEMVDFFEICLRMKPPKGRRVCIIAWGGGPSVITTDDCEMAGLSVPPLTARTREGLKSFIPEAGSSVSNPIDSPVLANPSLLSRVIESVAQSREADLLLIRLPFAVARPPFDLAVSDAILEAIILTSRSIDVPLVVVQPHANRPESSGQFFTLHQKCTDAGLPLLSSTHRAAQAVSRFIDAASRLDQQWTPVQSPHAGRASAAKEGP